MSCIYVYIFGIYSVLEILYVCICIYMDICLHTCSFIDTYYKADALVFVVLQYVHM